MKRLGVFLVCLLYLMFFASLAEARNPELSKWLKKLSESALADEPKNPDYAPR